MPRRNTGKRFKSRSKAKKPRAMSLEEYSSTNNIDRSIRNVSYGIIEKYHGRGGTCSATILNGDRLEYLPEIKLKKSLRPKHMGQRLVKDSIILVTDKDTIVYIYDDHEDLHHIDQEVLFKLTQKEGDGESQDVIFASETSYLDESYLPAIESDEEESDDETITSDDLDEI
jgi:hypothetical protein